MLQSSKYLRLTRTEKGGASATRGAAIFLKTQAKSKSTKKEIEKMENKNEVTINRKIGSNTQEIVGTERKNYYLKLSKSNLDKVMKIIGNKVEYVPLEKVVMTINTSKYCICKDAYILEVI